MAVLYFWVGRVRARVVLWWGSGVRFWAVGYVDRIRAGWMGYLAVGCIENEQVSSGLGGVLGGGVHGQGPSRLVVVGRVRAGS